jgi:hypothetical protein
MIKPLGVEILNPNSPEVREAMGGNSKEKEEPKETPAAETDKKGSPNDGKMQVIGPNGPEWVEKEKVTSGVNNIKEEEQSSSDFEIFKKLYDEGLLEADSEEFELKSLDDVKAMIEATRESERERARKEYLESLTPKKKKFLEIADSTGDEQLAESAVQDLQLLSVVDDDKIREDEELASYIVGRSLALRGFNQGEIDERIEELKDLDKLSDKAIEAKPNVERSYNSIISHKQAEAERLHRERQEAYNQTVEEMYAYIEEAEELFPGYNMTNRTKQKLKDTLSKVAHTDKQGMTYTQIGYKQNKYPQQFNIAIGMLDVLGLLDFDAKGNWKPSIDKIKASVTKDVSKRVDDMVKDQQELERGQNKGVNANSGFDLKRLEDMLG